MDKKWRYLSFRIKVFGIMILSVCGFAILMAALTSFKTEKHILPVILLITVYLVLIFFFVTQIMFSLKKEQQQIQLFLAGYTMEGLRNLECTLSPEMDHLFYTVYKLLKSGKMLEGNKRQAQYLALQNQINPHFLYNTLESIRSEAMEAGIINVTNMTEALANFFRYTVSKVENMVTLEEELENIKTYFYIQQYRFEDRINLSVEYSEDDRDMLFKCLLPKLTLQPVVENSIIHGLERKMGEGTVRIIMTYTDKRILIQISDDGVGMQPEIYEKINQQLNQPVFESIQMSSNKGIALVNVNNRIHLIFGEEYGMTLNSTPGVGTDMYIQLPLVTSMRDIKIGEELS